MNAIPFTSEQLAAARDEAHRLLGAAAHYCRCAQLHLEADDDPVAIYDLAAARGYFVSAIRSFEPLRAAIRQRAAEAEDRRID